MEKYGTYDVFENQETKEIERVPLVKDEKTPAMTKVASGDWTKLEKDPETKGKK